jgi:hypothetical protein
MRARWDGALFALCLGLQGCIVCALTFAARSGCRPSVVTIGLGLCFAPYAGVLILSSRVMSKTGLDRLAVALALLFGAAFLLAPPVLSDDLYRYLWEGRLWLEGHNPYRLAPQDPALAYLRDDVWGHINHKPLASIYPPLSQLLFVVAAWLGSGPWTVKLLALVAHVSSVAAVSRICGRREAGLALALNPLLLSEAALNGHFDILTGVALLIAALALSRDRFFRAGLAASAAAGLKVVGLALLPLFARRPRAVAATALVSGSLVLPLAWWRAPIDPSSGAGQFASRWRGNESAFALLDWLSRRLVDEAYAELAARAAVTVAVVGFCVVAARRGVSPLSASRAVVWALLLLSPQVHPWYLAWLLPLEAAAGAVAGLVWSAAVLCAYAPLDRWVADGAWDMPLWLQISEYSVVVLALVLDPMRPSLQERVPSGNSR